MNLQPLSEDLHPEAENLLALINMPEMLETQTLADIHGDLRRAGYEEVHPGTVTNQWQRKVKGSSKGSKTCVLIRTADGSLVELGVGGSGQYSLAVLVENADAITDTERAAAAQLIRNYREYLPHILLEGPGFTQAADKLLGASVSPVEKESRTFMQRISALMGKKGE